MWEKRKGRICLSQNPQCVFIANDFYSRKTLQINFLQKYIAHNFIKVNIEKSNEELQQTLLMETGYEIHNCYLVERGQNLGMGNTVECFK